VIITGDIGIDPIASSSGFEEALLEWAAQSDLFEHPFKLRTYDISGVPLYRFHAEMVSPRLGRKVLGSGSDRSKVVSAAKAVAEAIERVVVLDLSETARSTWYDMELRGGELQSEATITPSASPPSLPPDALNSTNGWAIHYESRRAIQFAVREALERHILLYSYLKDGWAGFDIRQSGKYQGRQLYSLFTKYSFACHGAGICAIDGANFPGVVLGYLCDQAASLSTSDRWGQAFFEAYEASLFYDQPTPPMGWVDKYGYGILADYQRHYVHSPIEFVAADDANKPKLTSVSDSIAAHLRLIDVAPLLNLPVPLYAAQVFGGDLLPLAFSQEVQDEESKSYIGHVMKRWGFLAGLPEYHPIL